MRERGAIDRLSELFGHGTGEGSGKSFGRVLQGIGDDAAVLASTNENLVWTVDACVESVHFDRRWLSLEDVGWRSMQAAVSDVAAMGARPIATLSSLVLPPTTHWKQLRALGAGQAAAATQLKCPVVGGNISSGDVLSVTTTVLGAASKPLLRSGARVGQELWLVGNVGLAAAGLRLLQGDQRSGRARRARALCLSAWRRPEAQTRFGHRLASCATAAIDLSDGLAGDCLHLAESSEVRVVIEEGPLSRVLRSELRAVAELLDTTALELALTGGEDYALLATGPHHLRPRWAHRIGRVEAGRGAWILTSDGRERRLGPGFEHC